MWNWTFKNTDKIYFGHANVSENALILAWNDIFFKWMASTEPDLNSDLAYQPSDAHDKFSQTLPRYFSILVNRHATGFYPEFCLHQDGRSWVMRVLFPKFLWYNYLFVGLSLVASKCLRKPLFPHQDTILYKIALMYLVCLLISQCLAIKLCVISELQWALLWELAGLSQHPGNCQTMCQTLICQHHSQMHANYIILWHS